MYIDKVYFKDFRLFKNQEFFFGPYLNCISGYNGVGKSTILAVLSNVGELKKEIGSHLNGNTFRGEFSNLIHGDKSFDKSGYNYDVYFKDLPPKDSFMGYTEKLSFRSTFQTRKIKKERREKIEVIINGKTETVTKIDTFEEVDKHNFRYRHIPIKTKERDTESKVTWPTYYLGLSRLYPIGESEEINSKTKIPNDIFNELMKTHKRILNSNDEYIQTASIEISDTKRKKGFGVRTKTYSEKMNSAGQDNLGQILETVYSFKLLKEKMKNEYLGGLLLIDEIDATLHPVAQNKLIDFLYTKSIELNLQIVFTTHSLSLLEHVNKKRRSIDKNDGINTIYLTTKRGKLEPIYNPETIFLHNDLMNTYSGAVRTNNITVYTEDETARWFLRKIINHYQKSQFLNLELVEINTGWSNIIKLILNDFDYFRNQLVILDPDLNDKQKRLELEKTIVGTPYTINTNKSNILILPGETSIEKMFWNYLSNLEQDNIFFYDSKIESIGLNKMALIENGPFSKEYLKFENERIKIKKWFIQNSWMMDIAFRYWINEESNSNQVEKFWNRLQNIYNIIFRRIQI